MIGCGAPEILYLPSPPRELVVNCIGYNYHPWEADLSLSNGILESQQDSLILDATVKLYEDDVFVETFVNDSTWLLGEDERGTTALRQHRSPARDIR